MPAACVPFVKTMENQLSINNENINNSTVTNNVTQILGKSIDYKELEYQLKTQQKLFNLTPEDEQQERLEISAKINELENRLKQFKDDVLRLAEQFNRIEINTDRLKRAKEHFDKGEIGESRAVLEMELEQMTDENNQLIKQRDNFEQDVLPKLKANAEEFLILALSTQSNYDNPNWFKSTCDYFERSINADPTKNNIFEYAVFLFLHNKLNEAELNYQRYLTDFAAELSDSQIVMTLNNLGILYKTLNEFEKALNVYEKVLTICNFSIKNGSSHLLPDLARMLDNCSNLHAKMNEFDKALSESQESLEIFQELANENASVYSPDLALTLCNLAKRFKTNNKLDKSLETYKKSIAIYQNLVEQNPFVYLPYFAMALNNLAILYQSRNEDDNAKETFEKVLDIYQKLAKDNPISHLFGVANTFNNLAGLHIKQKNVDSASQYFEEAVKIYRQLANENFQLYFPNLAGILSNLSLFYQEAVPHQEKSVNYAVEAINILTPYVEHIPFMQEHFIRVITVLRRWGLSDEQIEQLITAGENQKT
jgi:TolA-binding protein